MWPTGFPPTSQEYFESFLLTEPGSSIASGIEPCFNEYVERYMYPGFGQHMVISPSSYIAYEMEYGQEPYANQTYPLPSQSTSYKLASNEVNKDLDWPEGVNIDPLIAAIYRNATKSPLCGLADHILVNIMQQTDLTTACQLRRASRTFMRIFSSRLFSKWHENGDGYGFLWKSPFQAKGWVKALSFAAPQTRGFCRGCKTNRTPRSWLSDRARAFLYCSGCDRLHPTSVFSIAERQKRSHSRVCIGREGHIRLCEHKTFTWDDFVKAEFQHTKGNAPWASQVALLKRRRHLRFPNRKCPVTAVEFRRRIAELRELSPCSWYPEEGPRRLDPMLCFDPNSCHCLHYEGIERYGIPVHDRVATKSDAERRHSHKFYRWTTDETAYFQASFRNCGSHKHCWEFTLDRTFGASEDSGQLSPSSPQWYLALDPASYNLKDDTEFKEITWCEDQACRNYCGLREHSSLGTTCLKDRELV
ncbi:hypothetical protein K456DRAFT_1940835 [Colletotrichum gloeosporioides 23]|nr:hypothetical protein K456DRAFT_1940835 [Colletotrichum gloeosporioides 23]